MRRTTISDHAQSHDRRSCSARIEYVCRPAEAPRAGYGRAFEEPIGVTVYTFDGRGYRREAFLKGFTLTKAIKKYAAR